MTEQQREKRDPWVKFYFADWRAETRLKLCCRAARSFWFDVLGIMHEADPYGFLMVEGIVPTPAQIARLMGDSERDVKRWMGELLEAGVPSVVGLDMPADVEKLLPPGMLTGIWLSRRMVRDRAKKIADKINGKGGGNPHLTGGDKGGVNPPDNGQDKPPDNRTYNKRDNRSVGGGDKAQKPEARNQKNPQNPPSARDNPPSRPPPPEPDPSWAEFREKALKRFGQGGCEQWLFPCPILRLAVDEWALEAPSSFHQRQIQTQYGHKLPDFFTVASVKVVIARAPAQEGAAAS